MKKRRRLLRQAEFQSLLQTPRYYSGRSLIAFAQPAAQPEGGRVGIAVSRRVRSAVSRNRIRRRLREATRLRLLGADSESGCPGISFDVILIARPVALTAPFEVLLGDADAVRRRLRSAGR